MAGVTTGFQPDSLCSPARLEAPCILHVLPTFAVGGVQVRTAEIINDLGNAFDHAIVALDGNHACKTRLTGEARVDFAPFAIKKKRTMAALLSSRAALRSLRPDLLVTSNWGAIEWALANTISPVCPHIHLEDGFGLEEADRQFLRRMHLRRIALARTAYVVVPSEKLVHIAIRTWKISPDKVILIPNGVDCSRFARVTKESNALGFESSENGLVVGTVAPLRPEKDLGFLLDAFAEIAGQIDVRLMIVGDGSERANLMRRAQTLRIADRVYFTGHMEAVERALASFDVFALTSRTEQMPFSILQAMAAGKPVAAVDVGDVKLMLSPENHPFVAPRDHQFAFRAALAGLLKDAAARARIGAQNRTHVQRHYPRDRMLDAYRNLFEASIGQATHSGASATSMGR